MKKIINVNVEIEIDEDEVILCSKYCFYREHSPYCGLFNQELIKIKQYDNPKRCDLCLISKEI